MRRFGEQISPILLEHSPAALATGYRCKEQGYGFYWPPYADPFMVKPDGTVIPHVTEDYLPYVYEPPSHSVLISGHTPVGFPGAKVPGGPMAETYEGTPKAAGPSAAETHGEESADDSSEHALDYCQKIVNKIRADPKLA